MEQIEHIRTCGQIVFAVQKKLEVLVEPGVTTNHLDAVAEAAIRETGARPAFKGYHGFPASICASVNASIVHGFPTDEPLSEGEVTASTDIEKACRLGAADLSRWFVLN